MDIKKNKRKENEFLKQYSKEVLISKIWLENHLVDKQTYAW